jgi:peptidoglycan hydrolase-like protein with peptidoglycan-binding domain
MLHKKIEPTLTIFTLPTVLMIVMTLCVGSAEASTASTVAQCIGYTMSRQDEIASSISGVDCTAVQKKLAGMIDEGFFLSGINIDHYNTNGDQGIIQGFVIHRDRFEREMFNSFTINVTGLESTKVTDVSIQAISNLKPKIKLYIVPSDKISLNDLETLDFTRSLELASEHARRFDNTVGPDTQPVNYLVIAFQLNRVIDRSRLKLFINNTPGSMEGAQTGKMINKNGWILVAAAANMAFDSGEEKFFNLIQEQDIGHEQVAGVYSNHSLERRVQRALAKRGYSPGPADGKPGKKTTKAIKSYQKSIGLSADGKITPSLLRLLMSPDISSAALLMQKHLSYLNYDVGKIDGALGSKSRKAIRSFQKDNGMTEDGKVTAALVCRATDAVIRESLFRDASQLSNVNPTAVAVTKGNRFENQMWLNQATQ